MEYLHTTDSDIDLSLSGYEAYIAEDDIQQKLATFAIYDYKLSGGWGAFSKNIIELFLEKTKTQKLLINYSMMLTPGEEVKNNYFLFRKYIKNLFDFFENPEAKYIVCEFGTHNHATCIYLNKNNGLIKIVYINTGYGLNAGRHESVKVGDIEYWDIFKVLYINNTAIEYIRFIQNLTPFIINCYCKSYNLKKHDYYDYLRTAPLKQSINAPNYDNYYEELYESDDKQYFEKVHNLFSGIGTFFTPVVNNVDILNVNTQLNEFITTSEQTKSTLNLTYPLDIYFHKALTSIKGHMMTNGKVYFMDQQGGTCTYRSVLFAWIYFYCDIQSTVLITTLFKSFCDEMCRFLIEYIPSKKNLQVENINLNLLIEYLVDDKILDASLRYKERNNIQLHQKFTITPREIPTTYIYIFPVLSIDDLNELLNDIRNNTSSAELIYKKCITDKQTAETDADINIKKVYMDNAIKETMILLALCEYYKNYYEWNYKLDYRFYINDCIMTGRIELLNHECLWIAKYINYLEFNRREISISNLKYIWLCDTVAYNSTWGMITPIMGYTSIITTDHYRIAPNPYYFRNTIHHLKNIYQTLIFEDTNTSEYLAYSRYASINSSELNKVNLPSIKQILIDYINVNFATLNLYSANEDIYHDYRVLTEFVLDNSHIFGEKKTKYAILSIFKSIITKNVDFFGHIYNSNRLNYILSIFTKKYIFAELMTQVVNYRYVVGQSGLLECYLGLFDENIRKRKLINMTLEDVKNFIINTFIIFNYDYDEIIEYFNNHNFEINSVINNKRLVYADNKYYLDLQEIIPVTVSSDFIKYLFNVHYGENCIFYNEKSKQLSILFINAFYMNDDTSSNIRQSYKETSIMTLELENNAEYYNIKINSNGHRFNDKKIMIYNNDTIQIPFLLYTRNNCKNFIIEDDGSFSMLYIFNNWMSNEDVFGGIDFVDKNMFVSNPTKSIILEINIKNNMTTLMYNADANHKINILNDCCPYMYKVASAKLNLANLVFMKEEIDAANKVNLQIFGEYNTVCDATNSFCENIKKISDKVKKQLSANLVFRDIRYNLEKCTMCTSSGLNIIPFRNTITTQKEIFNETETVVNQNLQKFIRDHPDCTYNTILNTDLSKNHNICITIQSVSDTIDEKIKSLNDLLKTELSKVKYDNIYNDNYSIVDFINDNYTTIRNILQINIYLYQLARLRKIFTSKTFDTNEMLEINQLLKITNYKPRTKLLGVVEIILGIIIKKEQWTKMEEIQNNYDNRNTEKWQVHHFMMGKGKSSVITPLITINNAEQNINIIVPSHLIKQTTDTMYEFQQLFDLKLKIKDDVAVKHEYLMNTLPIEDNIYLIDEFDYMCNPLQSNYNLILSNELFYNEQLLSDLMKLIQNHRSKIPWTGTITKYSYLEEAKNILDNDYFVKDLTYGMSKKERKKRYCIPYARKDSPLEGSSFKSNIITLTLTILYFTINDYELEENDIKNIIVLKNAVLLNDISQYYSINIRLFKMSNFNYIASQINSFVHKKSQKEDRQQIFLKYIKVIMASMRQSTNIKNTSFYDIMNMNCLWQVGYSGTVNIILPDYGTITKYSTTINNDYDEILGTYFALTGNYPNSKNTIYNIKNDDYAYIIYLFGPSINHNVLIDACAYLKDKKNEIIAQDLSDVSDGKRVIYLTENDDKMMFYNGNHMIYDGKIYDSENTIYYYSQKHIIGVDFKQPNILKGLVLINDSNNYTEIAQAIYRMRKLNRGHISNIGYCGKNEDILILDQYTKEQLVQSAKEKFDQYAKENLYKQLVDNDIKNRNNIQNLSSLLMFKHFCRKYINNNLEDRAVENWLVPIYTVNDTERFIYNIIIKNIASNIVKNTEDYTDFLNFENPTMRQAEYNDYQSYMTQLFFNNTEKFIEIGCVDDSDKILTSMCKLKLKDLLSVLYDIDTNDVPQAVTEEENQQEVEEEREHLVQFQRERNYLNDEETVKLQQIVCRFYYNPDSTTENNYYKWHTFNTRTYEIIFSTNLLMILPKDVLSICIVRLSPTTFLVENIYTIGYYYNKFPIYSMNGIIINQQNVPHDRHFIHDEDMLFTTINLHKLFDFNVRIDSAIFHMLNLVGGNVSTNFITVIDTEHITVRKRIFVLLIILNSFIQINSTATGITEDIKRRLLDYYECIEYINSFNVADYRRYIFKQIKDNLNCSSITHKPLTIAVPSKQFEYQYIFYTLAGVIKLQFTFDNSNLSGGGLVLKKYKILNIK